MSLKNDFSVNCLSNLIPSLSRELVVLSLSFLGYRELYEKDFFYILRTFCKPPDLLYDPPCNCRLGPDYCGWCDRYQGQLEEQAAVNRKEVLVFFRRRKVEARRLTQPLWCTRKSDKAERRKRRRRNGR